MSELAPPRKSVELEDPGAHELDHSEESDVFSDAQEGQQPSSGSNSPIPKTRVEKVDDHENHGEVPGTEAYNIRSQDAVPDEVEVVPEGQSSRRGSTAIETPRSGTPGSSPIPKTVVEKIDPKSPSHGDVPGTTAHALRKADAVPDQIKPASSPDPESGDDEPPSSIPDVPVPKTIITRVDSKPAHGEVPGTDAYDMRKGDAEPDILERKGAVADLPTSSLSRSTRLAFGQRKDSLEGASPIAADGGFGPMAYDDVRSEDMENVDTVEEPETDDGFGDDFDGFEAGTGDDDFGDFDEGFEQPIEAEKPAPPKPPVIVPESPFSLLDFSTISDLSDILDSTKHHLDILFPTMTDPAPLPSPRPAPQTPNPIFPTPRSASLWSQLVAPPPLQPPNWVRSRIRRLFLVSLGVPIDLDEILPASKQKKLILPSTLSPRSSSDTRRRDGSKVRGKLENNSSASLDQQIAGGTGNRSGRKKKGPPPQPELDLPATRRLCTTTRQALEGMTKEELDAHVVRLEEATVRAREVLNWWERRREEKLGDKEAFEGVIENLVRHARRVRK